MIDKKSLFLSSINKDEILKRVSQEDLFKHYLGKIELQGRFCSPFRQDKNPTCSMAYFNEKLYFRDWSRPRAQDIFSVVQELFNLSYFDALNKIATDFQLWNESPNLELPEQIKAGKRNKKVVSVKIQHYTDVDLEYFSSFGIGIQQLQKFKVFSLRYLWIEGKTQHVYSDKDPCVGYYLGTDKYDFQKWKIYFYKRDKPRFLGNTNRISGWVQLPEEGDVVIITKSMKDVMVLDRLGVPAISMQSETTIPYKEIISELRSRFTTVCSLYDFDYAGVRGACTLRRLYNIPALFLTNGRFGTTNYGAKDISDYVRANGLTQAKDLVDRVLEDVS